MTTASSTEVHRWRAFALLAVAFFMTLVDVTIVNVALPTIGRPYLRIWTLPASLPGDPSHSPETRDHYWTGH